MLWGMKMTMMVSVLLISCAHTDEPKPAALPKDTDKCVAAEKNLERLKCKDRAGDPMWVNKKGERFGQTCRVAQKEGRIFLNPACVKDAKTCTAAKKCPAEGME